MPLLPEQQARERIDAMLIAAGWAVQSRDAANLHAAKGVAVREFHLLPGHGIADYLLFVEGKAVGVIEAEKEGEPLSGVEIQTEQYSVGLPPKYPAPVRPLPFLFQSTGVETWFTNRLDPEPRARRVFHLLRADAFADQLAADPLPGDALPGVLRRRLRTMPTLDATPNWNSARLRDVQKRAVTSLELSLRDDRPRALVQMATGSGKTVFAITAAYRLLRHALGQKPLLEPFAEQVEARYQTWLAEQAAAGVSFTAEQRQWLDAVRDHVASSLLVAREDLQESPFATMGGLAKARRLFGEKLEMLLDDLNRILVA